MKCPFLKRTTIIHPLVQSTSMMASARDRTETREEFFVDCLGKDCLAFRDDFVYPCRRLQVS